MRCACRLLPALHLSSHSACLPLPLSPAQVVHSASSLILAGGTLQPFSAITSQLLPRLPPSRLRLFACGHIVPSRNVAAMAVGTGPSGLALDFTFHSRMQPQVVRQQELRLSDAECGLLPCHGIRPPCLPWHLEDSVSACSNLFQQGSPIMDILTIDCFYLLPSLPICVPLHNHFR